MYCPTCGTPLADRPDLAGQWFSCPACGGPFQVPAPVAAHQAAPLRPIPPQPLPARSTAPLHALHAGGTTVHVNIPARPSNSLGISAIVLGIVGLPLSIVPILGVALCGIGALLGVIGFFAALGRRGSGVGFPIAGLAICGIGLLIQFSILGVLAALLATFSGPQELPRAAAPAAQPAPTQSPAEVDTPAVRPYVQPVADEPTLRPRPVITPEPSPTKPLAWQEPRTWNISGKPVRGALRSWTPRRVVIAADQGEDIVTSPEALDQADVDWVEQRLGK